MRQLALVSSLAVTLVTAACDSTSPDKPPAEVTATLISPNGAEAAAVLEFSGGGVQSVAAADAATQVFSSIQGAVTRVVIVRDAPGALSVRLRLADPGRPPTATVVEVADGANALRASLTGYRVEF